MTRSLEVPSLLEFVTQALFPPRLNLAFSLRQHANTVSWRQLHDLGYRLTGTFQHSTARRSVPVHDTGRPAG